MIKRLKIVGLVIGVGVLLATISRVALYAKDLILMGNDALDQSFQMLVVRGLGLLSVSVCVLGLLIMPILVIHLGPCLRRNRSRKSSTDSDTREMN